VSNLFCQSTASTQFICSNILFLVAGFSRAELNTVRIKDIKIGTIDFVNYIITINFASLE